MSTITGTISIVLPDTSALDDASVEDDALTDAWSSAVARAVGKAEREDRRAKRTAAQVTAKRTEYSYEPIPDAIQDHLAAYPAF